MFHAFLQFSGILAIFVAWIFLVFPAFWAKIDNNIETITSATNKNKSVQNIVGLGLVIGAVFQVVFLYYLTERFSLSLLSIGPILYMTANIATVLVALFTSKRNSKVHNFLTRYYFTVMPLSLIFISLSIDVNSVYLAILFAILIFYFLGAIFLFFKYRTGNFVIEQWSFLLLSIWTLIMTFI